jgi:hypothetical protein
MESGAAIRSRGGGPEVRIRIRKCEAPAAADDDGNDAEAAAGDDDGVGAEVIFKSAREISFLKYQGHIFILGVFWGEHFCQNYTKIYRNTPDKILALMGTSKPSFAILELGTKVMFYEKNSLEKLGKQIVDFYSHYRSL